MTDFNLDTLGEIKSSFQQYVVSPLNAFGIGGFIFDVEGDETANLTAEITDHYTEGNTTFQDHIAIKPKKVTLKSYVGELRRIVDETTNTTVQTLTQKLSVLSGFLPQLSKTETQFANLLTMPLSPQSLSNNFQSITNDSVNLYNLVKNSIPPQNRQAQAYAYFKALFDNKTLLSVQTPFEFMSQMAIESITAMQPEESKNISHFTIVLKEIRVASTLVQAGTQQNVQQGRTQQQAQPIDNVGNTPGINPAKVPPSLTVNGLANPNLPIIREITDVLTQKNFLPKGFQ